jgi:hypothetical protein
VTRRCIPGPAGYALVPVDPPLAPDDIQIDLSALDTEADPVHPLDQIAVAEYRRAARRRS